MGRLWRAYHEDLEPLAGAELALAGEEAHHVFRVLRLGIGERIAVFDGRGNEWQATIVGSAPRRIDLRLEQAVETPVESPLDVTLFQGVCKTDRMEWVVQKATELGLRVIAPLRTARAERSAPDDRRLERWRRIAVESCKQCGRRTLPRIEPVDALPSAPPGTTAILLDPSSKRPLSQALRTATPAVWIAVGPEGGFTEEELRQGSERGWSGTDLGSRVLRTDTAGLVAASIVLHLWGDLGRPADVDSPGACS